MFASADTGGFGSPLSKPGFTISRPAGPGGLRLRNPAPSLFADARSPATRIARRIEVTPPVSQFASRRPRRQRLGRNHSEALDIHAHPQIGGQLVDTLVKGLLTPRR